MLVLQKMPRPLRSFPCPALLRGAALTLACLWLTLPTDAKAQPRLTESVLSAPMLAGPADDNDASLSTSSRLDGEVPPTLETAPNHRDAWIRAKMVRQWGVMMLVEALAFTALLGMWSAQDDGYPFEEDGYGCGGRAAPITAAAIGAVGLVLTIKGTFEMRRHAEGRPERFGRARRPIRRWSPLLAMGALGIAGALTGAAFHDLFCSS